VRLISLTKLLLLLCRAHYSPSPSNAERRTSSSGAALIQPAGHTYIIAQYAGTPLHCYTPAILLQPATAPPSLWLFLAAVAERLKRW